MGRQIIVLAFKVFVMGHLNFTDHISVCVWLVALGVLAWPVINSPTLITGRHITR